MAYLSHDVRSEAPKGVSENFIFRLTLLIFFILDKDKFLLYTYYIMSYFKNLSHFGYQIYVFRQYGGSMYTYHEVKSNFEIEGFYTAIKYDWNEPFVFNGESHDFWEAVFVESGRVEVTEDENFYTLSEGNVIFHAPMEFHRIKSAEGSSPKLFVFSFKTAGELPQAIRAGVFTVNPSQIKLFDALRDSVYDYVHKNSSAILGEKATSLLKLFIIEMAKSTITANDTTSQSAREYQRIISFMSKNILENLTLEDIARRTNISVSYMKILFKTYAGIAPKSYYNMLRIQIATELLNKGNSVTEVSLAMNFSSPNYFSLFFKRETGCSPSRQYRNM